MANVLKAYRRLQEQRRKNLKVSCEGISEIIMEAIPEFALIDIDLYFPDGKIDIFFDRETDTITIIIDNSELAEYYNEEMANYAMIIEDFYPGIKLEGKITVYLKKEKIAFWMTKDDFEGSIEGEYQKSLETLKEDFKKVFKKGDVYILDNGDKELYIAADCFVMAMPINVNS